MMRSESDLLKLHENRGLLTFWGMNFYAVASLISMATMSTGAGILVLCILFEKGGIRRFLAELKESFQSPWLKSYVYCSAFLILACILSLASARWFPLSFGGKTVPVHWLKDLGKMWYFFFPGFLLIAWRRLAEPERAKVLRTWLVSFGVLSSIGVVQLFTGWPRAQPNPLLPGYFHTGLFLGHHLSLASIWIFPFFACLDLAWVPERVSKSLLSQKMLAGFLSVALFTLIFAYSRTLWVALPIGLAAWALGKLSRKGALSFLVLMAVSLVGLSQLSIFQRRFQNQMGISSRMELWKANLHFISDRPVFGVGLGKNLELSADYFQWLHPEQKGFFVGHAHNIYLEVLAGLGGVGAVAWLVWVCWVLGALHWVSQQPQRSLTFSGGLLVAWLVFLLNGLTQVNFWEGKVMHQLMWQVGLIFSWIFPSSIGFSLEGGGDSKTNEIR